MAGSETLNAVGFTAAVKAKAQSLGFHLVGVCASATEEDRAFYEWWVDQGFAASMHYLGAQKERRRSLSEILPGARSAVVCALRFPGGEEKKPEGVVAGKIARYALNEDYHNRILPLLKELGNFIDVEAGAKSLAYVDTGAIPERALAKQAGLGWIGKNAMLIHPEEGSWFWLGEVITTAELVSDAPVADHCGKCRRCIDACPTNAILEDLRAVDSRKCIAYLNIEHRGPIPTEFHKPMGDWLLGCDICQEVCPWNEHSLRKARKEEGAPPREWIEVEKILAMTPQEFNSAYRPRAVSRAKHAGMQRNAEIVKKNHE